MDVKVYAAGFYTEMPLTSEADVLECRESPIYATRLYFSVKCQQGPSYIGMEATIGAQCIV